MAFTIGRQPWSAQHKVRSLLKLRFALISILIALLIITTGTISQARNHGSIHLILGTPSPATVDVSNRNDYLMLKPQYALSYNNEKGIPNWVSWQLNAAWLGTVDRCKTFSPDPALPSGFKAVTPTDYLRSGFSRGHMTRSGDRTRSATDNCATFTMTNIVPQVQDNNEGPWLELENLSRDLAIAGKELYIVAGTAGVGGTGLNGYKTTIGKNAVTVPASLWKIVVLLDKPGVGIQGISEKTRVIAVNMPNTTGIKTESYRKYLTTVDELEKLTGYDFLSDVSTAIQNAIEARKDAG